MISGCESMMQVGKLAKEWCGASLPLQIMESAAGFYIGTAREDGPCSRESSEYWPTHAQAERAFELGQWTQRDHP